MLVVGKHLRADDGWNSFVKQRPAIYQAGQDLCQTLLDWAKENEVFVGAGGFDEIERELKSILPYVSILGDGLRGNPRQIKRFLNILALRRQLAAANGLEVDDAMLIKMTVLEYVWEEFFNALVDTVDPTTGQSPLAEELATDRPTNTEEKSEVVEEFAEKAHLITFLRSEPQLTGQTDLRPYLFLAQTSISRGKQSSLLPPDEKALSLAKSIAGKDRIISKASALKAAAEDASTVQSIVRHLTSLLAASDETQGRIHIITGLDTICMKHPQAYEHAATELSRLNPGNNTAMGIAGASLLKNAKKFGVNISEEDVDRFSKAAGILSVLTGGKGSSSKKK